MPQETPTITITLRRDEWETVLKGLHILTVLSANWFADTKGENPFAIYDYIRDEVPTERWLKEKAKVI